MLSVSNLSVTWGVETLFSGVSFSVSPGECIGIIGDNGSGKSTLLKAILGQVPYSGTITLNGQLLDQMPSHKRALAGIVYVPQTKPVFESLTVLEHLRLCNGDATYIQHIPTLYEDRYKTAKMLSGGQRRQLALACARTRNAKYLLLDEPTSGLDTSARKSVQEMISQAKTSGIGIILVEHHMDFIAQVADRILDLEPLTGGTN